MRLTAILLALMASLAAHAGEYYDRLQAVYKEFTDLRGRVGAFEEPIPYSRADGARAVERELLRVQGRLVGLPYGGMDPDDRLDYEILEMLIEKALVGHRSAIQVTEAMGALPFEETVRAVNATSLATPGNVSLFVARCERVAEQCRRLPSGRDFQTYRDAHRAKERADDAARTIRVAGRRAARETEDDAAIDKASEAAGAALQRYAEAADALAQKLPGRETPWAAGEAKFRYLIRYNDGIELTPDELISLGRQRLAETKRAMREMAERISPGKTVDEVWAEMQNDHSDGLEIVDVAKKNIEDAIALIQSGGFVTIPDYVGECGVREVGAQSSPYYPFGCYSGRGVRDGVYRGDYVVNPGYDYMGEEQLDRHRRANNIYWTRVVTLHEGFPGHHLQLGYASAITDPIRHATYSNTLVEGWGLYTEDLMYRHGYFPDERYRLAQLKMRAWRCVRVILDCSLHCKGMTQEEAVDFLSGEVGMERISAEAEVRRYLTSPTQPLSYLIGWITLNEMADAYKKQVGPTFSERDFHDELLSLGSLPIKLIRKRMLASPPPTPIYTLPKADS